MFNKKLKAEIDYLRLEIKFLNEERWKMKHETWRLEADIKMMLKHFCLSIDDISERRLTDVRAQKNKPEECVISTPNQSASKIYEK